MHDNVDVKYLDENLDFVSSKLDPRSRRVRLILQR